MKDKDRIAILEKAKKELLSSNVYQCICKALSNLIRPMYTVKPNIFFLFPELLRYKPKHKDIDEWWWPNNYYKKRIKIIDNIIRDIKKKKSNKSK